MRSEKLSRFPVPTWIGRRGFEPYQNSTFQLHLLTVRIHFGALWPVLNADGAAPCDSCDSMQKILTAGQEMGHDALPRLLPVCLQDGLLLRRTRQLSGMAPPKSLLCVLQSGHRQVQQLSFRDELYRSCCAILRGLKLLPMMIHAVVLYLQGQKGYGLFDRQQTIQLPTFGYVR